MTAKETRSAIMIFLSMEKIFSLTRELFVVLSSAFAIFIFTSISIFIFIFLSRLGLSVCVFIIARAVYNKWDCKANFIFSLLNF